MKLLQRGNGAFRSRPVAAGCSGRALCPQADPRPCREASLKSLLAASPCGLLQAIIATGSEAITYKTRPKTPHRTVSELFNVFACIHAVELLVEDLSLRLSHFIAEHPPQRLFRLQADVVNFAPKPSMHWSLLEL